MRAEKQYMIDDIRRRLTGSEFAYFVDFTRLPVARMSALRTKLRASGAELRVVKNRLLKIVCSSLGWTGIDEMVQKPTALVTGKDDIAAARVIQEFVKAEEKPLTLKGGVMNGLFLKANEVMEIANLPSREQLRQQVVGTIAAPMSRLVGVMNQKLCSLVYVLQAVEKKKGQ